MSSLPKRLAKSALGTPAADAGQRLALILTPLIGAVLTFLLQGLRSAVAVLALLGVVIVALSILQGRRRFHVSLLSAFVILFTISLLDFTRFRWGQAEIPYFALLFPLMALWLALKTPKLRRSSQTASLALESWLLLLFAGLLILSLLQSKDLQASAPATAQVIFVIAGYLVFSLLIQDRALLQQLVWIHIAAMVLVVLYTLYLFAFEPQHHYRLVVGSGRSSNVLGFVLLFPSLVVLAHFLIVKIFRRCLLFAAILAIFAMGMILTHSRGAWLSFVVGAGLLLWWLRHSTHWLRSILLLSILASALFALTPESVIQRLESDSGNVSQAALASIENRLTILNFYRDRLFDVPFFGDGLSVSAYVPGVGARQPHNSFLSIWVGAGIAALLTLVLFLLVHAANLRTLRLGSHSSHWEIIYSAVFAALLVELMLGEFVLGYQFWCVLAFQGGAVAASPPNPAGGFFTLQPVAES